MKKKYTPGPWTLGKGTVRVRTEEDEQGRTKLIAECYTTNQGIRYPHDFEEREANARLISAAPDLLEALQELLKSLPTYPVPPSVKNDTIRKARLAVGKATAEGGAL
jgi:hypothetical protein